jgi:aryl-alcohol dehydrogenase-like predicted oxidoreductase
MTTTLEIERRPLGRSDLTIPRIALGCGNFGGVGSAPELFGHGLSDDQAFELMDAAWALGIDHFDTADAYGGGRSERAIGRWIASRGVKPGLTTKTYNPMDAGEDSGLSPRRIERQLESSLRRLGVERVELYLAHEFDPYTALGETIGAFEEAQAAGRIRAYGVSNFDSFQLEAATTVGSPQAIQNEHSLLAGAEAVLSVCAERRVAFSAFSPLAGGWLTGKYRRGEPFPSGSRMTQRPGPYEGLLTDRTFDALDRLRSFSDERGTSMAGTALAWLLADDRVTQVVVGPGGPDHLEPVREALARPLGADERARLTEVFE